MTDDASAPQGGWSDKPPSAPAPAPQGQAPSPAGAPPEAGDTPPKGTSSFDAEAYLSTLPEDERAAKASLPPHILERDSKRQMLRSTFDRNRGKDAEELRLLRAQNETLLRQNQQMIGLIETSQQQSAGEPPASPSDLAKEVYDADSPEAYGEKLIGVVDARVASAVDQMIENHPSIRQLRAGIALRSARGSGEGYEEADYQTAQRELESDLASQGVTIDQLDPPAIKFMLPKYVRAAKAERLLQQHQGNGDTTPRPPAQPPASVPPTLPLSGSGSAPASPRGGEQDPYGPESSLSDRIDATLKTAGLTREQLAQLASNF